MTVSYQTVPLDGELKTTKLMVAMFGGGDFGIPVPLPVPLPPVAPAEGEEAGGTPSPAPTPGVAPLPGKPGLSQGVPTFELFDRDAGAWVEFAQLQMGQAAVIEHPERFVDGTGALLVRFEYHDPQQTGQQAYFNFGVTMEGVVE